METRTELIRIAEEMHALASDSAFLNLERIRMLMELSSRLEVVIEQATEEALLEAYRKAS